jgi:hypothetical protein
VGQAARGFRKLQVRPILRSGRKTILQERTENKKKILQVSKTKEYTVFQTDNWKQRKILQLRNAELSV